jgi:hypothetical protein
VFCECKKVESTPPEAKVWHEVVAQFLDTATVARDCGASLVVLASFVLEYPEEVRARIAFGAGLPHMLLTKQDLETGFRNVGDGQHPRRMRLDDVLPALFPERPREPVDGRRTINMGWGVIGS